MNQPLQQLRHIHEMMERSSRFIGLSGLSGIGAGTFALLGALIAYLYLDLSGYAAVGNVNNRWPIDSHPWGWSPIWFFVLDGMFVLVGALSCGIYFTSRRARSKGQAIWDKLTQRLLLHMAIPLATGGIFCLALVYYKLTVFVAPATLVFYGLALVNGSKYTLQDVFYLGLLEIVLGLIAMFFPGAGLLFWAIGFGVLHIVYGTLMYLKYERI